MAVEVKDIQDIIDSVEIDDTVISKETTSQRLSDSRKGKAQSVDSNNKKSNSLTPYYYIYEFKKYNSLYEMEKAFDGKYNRSQLYYMCKKNRHGFSLQLKEGMSEKVEAIQELRKKDRGNFMYHTPKGSFCMRDLKNVYTDVSDVTLANWAKANKNGFSRTPTNSRTD